MDIVYITDENYLMPTAVSITSLVMNTKTDLNIYVICNKLSDKMERIKSANIPNGSIHIIDVNGKYDLNRMIGGKTDKYRVTEVALLKFFLPDIFGDLDKILFIDSDTVVNKDLSDLYAVDLENYYVAATKDPLEYTDPKAFQSHRYTKDINTINDEFFNSGVMLMNLQQMRRDKIPEKAARKRMDYEGPFMDQGILNHVMCEKWKAVSNSYNFFSILVELYNLDEINKIFETNYNSYKDMLEGQSIIHFAGDVKPWLYDIPYVSDVFNQYYYQSPYSDEMLELKSLLVKRNKELEYMRELYHRLYRRTNFIRRPKNFIKQIFCR